MKKKGEMNSSQTNASNCLPDFKNGFHQTRHLSLFITEEPKTNTHTYRGKRLKKFEEK